MSQIFFWVVHPRPVAPHPALVDELLLVASLACTAFTDARMGVDPEPITVDASSSGGEVALACILIPSGSRSGKKIF
eukprot:10641699-Karenia_brevis.AAC.1